jgi:cholesterol transport system auxiliary component
MYTLLRIISTMYLIAVRALFHWARALFSIKNRVFWAFGTAVCVAGCATPQSPVAKAVYDFGPSLSAPAAAIATPLPALVLAEIDASTALESPAVVYRLGYADTQQLRPYTLARWSMPVAQLVRLRLRDALSTRGPVLSTAEGGATWLLKVELDEFSQLFDTPSTSAGVVRLRATLLRSGTLVAQRSLLARAPALSADAAGGVRALTQATDDAVQQLSNWIAPLMTAP